MIKFDFKNFKNFEIISKIFHFESNSFSSSANFISKPFYRFF